MLELAAILCLARWHFHYNCTLSAICFGPSS